VALGPGTRLGVYEILGPLGSGGMGEVYRARDLKLGRAVAIKVLPPALHDDVERLSRFVREATTLAALNHQNIAHIHGFEDSTGVPALVMELVEGPTLSDRIAKGPLPLDEALPIAKQIAEGLDAAHEQGIIHRDLKPANIKVRDDGTVKILDFGLAKALDSRPPSGINVTQSPTITTPAVLTGVGTILGTAAYMSPEQAKGKPADKRSDVWAFGCVLYEMLTGRRPFPGQTTVEVLSNILTSEPDWQALPEGTPDGVQRVLRRCLQKHAATRLKAVGDAVFELDDRTHAPSVSAPARRRLAREAAIAVLAVVIGAAFGWRLTRSTASNPPRELLRGRFSITLPSDAPLSKLDTPTLAVSPDGQQLAFAAGDPTRLFIRDLATASLRPVPRTEGASAPFFSPDGRSIGFFADGAVKRVSVDGTDVTTVCGTAGNPRGGAWNIDGTIAFNPAPGSALFRVNADGGDPQPLTTLDVSQGEGAHHWPDFISEGDAILYTVGKGTSTSWDDREIMVESLRTHQRHVVTRGTAARYVTPGHLIVARGGSLFLLPFDVQRLQTTGTPNLLADGVMQSAFGAAQFSVSRSGTFAYVPGGVNQRELVWATRSGATTALPTPPQTYWSVRLSPDARQLAIGVEGPTYGVWIYDLLRDTLTRQTFEGTSAYPIWTPDGKRLTFNSTKSGGVLNLFWKPIDGSSEEERLATSSRIQIANSWAPDGRTLAFEDHGERTGRDIWMLSLDRDRRVWPFAATPYEEGGAAFSPDGHWIAYVSTEGGAANIFLREFPGPGAKIQVSNDGGGGPVWSGDGRELFYRNGDRMMVVGVERGAPLRISKPRELFRMPALAATLRQADYDVTRDGQRFIMIRPRGAPARIQHVEIAIHAVGTGTGT
jgi:eukaryotic-like serine/threonine-protein kinase